MSKKKGIFTDGQIWVETWLAIDKKPVTSARKGTSNLKHYIRVENPTTKPMNYKVFGCLPDGNQFFKYDYPACSTGWKKKLKKVISNASADCDVEVVDANNSHGRIHCLKIKCKKYWAPYDWKLCRKRFPIEIKIKLEK